MTTADLFQATGPTKTSAHESFLSAVVEGVGRSFDQPVLLRDCAKGLVTAHDLLDTFRYAGTAYRDRPHTVMTMFALDGRVQGGDGAGLFAAEADRTLDGYCNRLERIGSGQFTATLFAAQAHNAALWAAFRPTIAELRHHVAFAGDCVEFDSFVGTYDRTPTGVHRDDASNVSIVVAGRKSMLFWPGERLAPRVRRPGDTGPELAACDAEPDGGTRIDAVAGDVICWPRSYWHVSIENVRTATLNIGFYRRASSSIEKALARYAPAVLAAGCPEPLEPRGCGEIDLPESWQRFEKQLAEVLSDADLKAITLDVLASFARAASRVGFGAVPAPRPGIAIDGDSLVVADPSMGLTWLEAADRTLLVAGGGRALTTTIDARPPLRRLYSRGAVRVADLLDDGLMTERQLIRLLSILHQWHAVDVRR